MGNCQVRFQVLRGCQEWNLLPLQQGPSLVDQHLGLGLSQLQQSIREAIVATMFSLQSCGHKFESLQLLLMRNFEADSFTEKEVFYIFSKEENLPILLFLHFLFPPHLTLRHRRRFFSAKNDSRNATKVFFNVNLNERNAKVHFSAETKKKLLPRSKLMISN